MSAGFVSKVDVAAELGVSIETIRRDISELCARKALRRVKGGAAPIKDLVRRDAMYRSRVHQLKDERVAIGRAAAALIRDNDIVAIDSGTSTQSIADAVTGVKNVTFVTDSLPSALMLYNKIDSGEITGRVIVIGGEMNTDRCTAGAMADDLVGQFFFDTAFICCSALSAQCVSSFNLDLCLFSKHLLRQTNNAVLVAESEKIGKNSLYGFATLTDFGTIIVDDKHHMTPEMMKIIEDNRIELIVAKRKG